MDDVAAPNGTFAAAWLVSGFGSLLCMDVVLDDSCCRRLQAGTLQAFDSLLLRVLHSSVTLLQTGLTAAQVMRGGQVISCCVVAAVELPYILAGCLRH
jgi:hypothetical protein